MGQYNDLKYKKALADKGELYLSMCKDERQKKRLGELYNEYCTAYNKYGISVLQASTLPKSRPMDPTVAAALGYNIAGLGGAVVAGTAAENQKNTYNQRVKQFENDYRQVKNKEKSLDQLYSELIKYLDNIPAAKDDWNNTWQEMMVKDYRKEKANTIKKWIMIGLLVLPLLVVPIIVGVAAGSWEYYFMTLIGGIIIYVICFLTWLHGNR